MNDFRDFVRTRTGQIMLDPSASLKLTAQMSSNLANADVDISDGKRELFLNDVVQIANSDAVLTELSESIGDPKENECEDEFVERAKSSMAKILRSKLVK